MKGDCLLAGTSSKFCEPCKPYLRTWNITDYLERKPKSLSLWESLLSFGEDLRITAILGWKEVFLCLCMSASVQTSVEKER